MKTARHHRSAFTLIEIMIVVALIGVAMATAIPSFRRGLLREGLVKSVSDIRDACGSARRLAILQGTPMELRISPQSGHFEVGAMTRDMEAGAAPPPFAQTQSAPAPAALASQPEQKLLPGMSGQLSVTLRIEMLDVNFMEYKDKELARVRFYPNGTSDELTLVLHSEDGEWRKISLEAVTALADVDDFHP